MATSPASETNEKLLRVYLDASAWIEILNGNTNIQDKFTVWMLAQSRIIDIIISGDVLEELHRTLGADERALVLHGTYIETCTKDRFLQPLPLRMATEWLTRRELGEAEKFVIELQRGWITSMLSPDDWCSIGVRVKDIKGHFDKSWRDAKKKIYERLQSDYSTQQERENITQMESMLADVAIERCKYWWIEDVKREQLDQMRTNISFRMYEHMMICMERFGEIGHDKGDAYDQAHYANARSTRCKYIVTEDEKLASISRRIREKVPDSPEPISTKDFIENLRGIYKAQFSLNTF